MKPIIIESSTQISKFHAHLCDQNNKRILVTAPFGAGKSYFLKEYFDTHNQYLPVTLYPVDYSVSSNEDIFELIKYDIIDTLMEVYGLKLTLSGNDFSNLLLAQQFMAKEVDLLPLFKSIAKIPSVGIEELLEIFESSKALYQKFKDYKEQMNDDEVSRLRDFMEPFEQKRGSIREKDAITGFISELLQRIKSEESDKDSEEPDGEQTSQTLETVPEKQTVLVVDDLDRLEADQIFRIFNIFSAHFDSRVDQNKFGFDKVILVCDLGNLKHMFHHRYGQQANFDGYIDKFYSYQPFEFNVQSFLKQKANAFFLHCDPHQPALTESYKTAIAHQRYGQKSGFFDVLSGLTEEMIDHTLLRARNFQKFRLYQLPESTINIEHRNWDVKNFPLLILASVFTQFFPRMTDFIETIETLSTIFPANYNHKSKSGHKNYQADLICYALPFLVDDYNEIANLRSNEEDQILEISNEFGEKVFIIYRVNDAFRSGYADLQYQKVVRSGGLSNNRNNEPAVSSPNYYYFLSLALKNCVRNGYL